MRSKKGRVTGARSLHEGRHPRKFRQDFRLQTPLSKEDYANSAIGVEPFKRS